MSSRIISSIEERGVKKSALILLLILLILVIAVRIFAFTHGGSPAMSVAEQDYTEAVLLEYRELLSALIREIYVDGERTEIHKEINALLQSNYAVNNAYQEQIIAEALLKKISEIEAFLNAGN